MTITQRAALLVEHYGYWGSCDLKGYGVDDWLTEVANKYTRSGYWEWVAYGFDDDEIQEMTS